MANEITPMREILPISKLHPNTGQLEKTGIPKNPRFIRDAKYKKLIDSLREDPDMMEVREVAVYDTGDTKIGYIVVGGNMRFRAAKELGYKEVPCKIYPTDTPADKLRRFILKDNSSFGETDFDELANWSPKEIASAAIDIPNIDFGDGSKTGEDGIGHGNKDCSKEEKRTHTLVDGDVWKLDKHYLVCRSDENLPILGELVSLWETRTGKMAVLLGNGIFKDNKQL